MAVDQAGREISAGHIDNLVRVIFSKADDATVVDRYARSVNFTAQHVNKLGVFKQQLSRFFAAGDTKFVLNCSHLAGRIAIEYVVAGVVDPGQRISEAKQRRPISML